MLWLQIVRNKALNFMYTFCITCRVYMRCFAYSQSGRRWGRLDCALPVYNVIMVAIRESVCRQSTVSDGPIERLLREVDLGVECQLKPPQR